MKIWQEPPARWGRQLLPRLVERGHVVIGTTRDESKQQLIRRAGRRPVVVDALGRDAVVGAVVRDEPDLTVHQLTAIPVPRTCAASRATSRRPTGCGRSGPITFWRWAEPPA